MEPALGSRHCLDNTPRPRLQSRGEGIVQPVSEEADKLSRRLHHHPAPGQDGRGLFFSTRHRNERRQLVVSVVSTEPAILDWIIATVDAGKFTGKRTVSDRHAPSFACSIANRQALDLLRQVVTSLRSYKRRRAELVLDEYLAVTPRNGRYSDALDLQRRAFEARFLGYRPGD